MKVNRHFVKKHNTNGDDQWHLNDQDKAKCLNDYFASILTVNDEHTKLPAFSNHTDNSLSHINCTEHEIESTIEILNPNKASGDDGISHKMLKGISNSFSKPLYILMNQSFDKSIFLIFGSFQMLSSHLNREIYLNYPTTDQLHF